MFQITDDMKNLATAFEQVGLKTLFRESTVRRDGHAYSFMTLAVRDNYGNDVSTVRFNSKGEYIVSWEFADVVDGEFDDCGGVWPDMVVDNGKTCGR